MSAFVRVRSVGLGFLSLACACFAASSHVACDTGGPTAFGPRSRATPSFGGDAGTPAQRAQLAQDLFHALEPDLTKACGGPCHTDGTSGGMPPKWLAGPDAYASIRAYPGIVVAAPDSSKLLIRGPHAGPALSGNLQPLADRVRAWLSAEAAILQKAVLPTTDPFQVAEGVNTVDISKGGVGVAGAKITFNARTGGAILTLSAMRLVAPAGVAVHVQHPIFVILPRSGVEKPDPVDSFSNVDDNVGPGLSAPLGPGEVLLVGWAADSKLRIEFTKLEPGKVLPDAGGVSGCKSVATFTSSAVPAIQGNTCLTCHDGSNAGATGALDLSNVGKDDAAACAQALSKVDLKNKPNSAILAAPTGKIQHPYQVGDAAAWTAAINGWIANE